MRCWPAVSLLALAVTLSAGAQHGGHGGGTHVASGGHVSPGSSHFSGAPMRGGAAFGPGARPGFARPGLAQHPGFAQRGYPGSFRAPGSRPFENAEPFRGGPASGVRSLSAARPTFFARSNTGYGHYGHDRYGYGRDRIGFAAPIFFYPSVFDLGSLDPFVDPWDDFYGDSPGEGAGNYATADPNQGYPAQAYPDQSYPGQSSPGQPSPDGNAYAPGPQSGYGAPASANGNVSSAPAPFIGPYRRQAAAPPAPLPQEDAVTLIFKDGRPAEQIHNYALTSTALVIPGQRLREIPLAELDLPATEQVNRAAGVDFRPPPAP